ncbi:hypothetical protein PG994_005298 [Apiospora phragmitis]|uniref:Uncharacterized protein n=1 Tax=Apiospora phragmitis TaxID=2905665 RepID=A0ABR1VBV2_9PEZI
MEGLYLHQINNIIVQGPDDKGTVADEKMYGLCISVGSQIISGSKNVFPRQFGRKALALVFIIELKTMALYRSETQRDETMLNLPEGQEFLNALAGDIITLEKIDELMFEHLKC